MSFDSPSKNATFKSNESFAFPLWSDQDKTLGEKYGAKGLLPFIADRVTVILDANANWVLHYPSDVVGQGSLYNHAQVVLDDVKALFAASSN